MKLFILLFILSAFPTLGFAGAKDDLDAIQRRISDRSAKITTLESENEADKTRFENIQEFITKRTTALNLTFNNLASADERCKKIKEAMAYLNEKNHPKSPFDGNRQKYASSLLEIKTDTLARLEKMTNTKNILSCSAINQLLKEVKPE